MNSRPRSHLSQILQSPPDPDYLQQSLTVLNEPGTSSPQFGAEILHTGIVDENHHCFSRQKFQRGRYIGAR